MILQPPLEALNSLNTFSQALDLLQPLIVGFAVLAVLVATSCLIGLFLTEATPVQSRLASAFEPRWRQQFALAGRWRGRRVKLPKLA